MVNSSRRISWVLFWETLEDKSVSVVKGSVETPESDEGKSSEKPSDCCLNDRSSCHWADWVTVDVAWDPREVNGTIGTCTN